MPLSLGTTGSR